MSFNTTPTLIDDVKHDMRTDERILRWIAVKQKALRPLKEYKAKDPRNLNLPTAPEPVPVVPTRPPAKYPARAYLVTRHHPPQPTKRGPP